MNDEANAGGQRIAWTRMFFALFILGVLTAALFLIAGDSFYFWAKAIHVIAVISWMAGMLYLPRLFVYHTDAERGSVQSETFKVMERRLLRGIINPAMTFSWVFGLWLAWKGFGFQGGWLHAKLARRSCFVRHARLSVGCGARFCRGPQQKPARHWRIVNEIPTLLMIIIVILVIVKPF
jgi:putative membrane protein